jgi:hypothetical protein
VPSFSQCRAWYRWFLAVERQDEPRETRYDALHAKIAAAEKLGLPTLDGVGHFPTREADDAVALAVLEYL